MNPVDRTDTERRFKGFWLTNFAVEHPTSVLALTGILIIFGILSYLRIPKESAPEITIPMVAVNTSYPSVAPADIESLITRPLEEELNKIPEVTEIRSTSVEGYSNVNVEFAAGMNMTEALQLVREKVDIAKPELPAAAEEPMILEFNFSEWPILQVNVSGEYSLARLKKVAEDVQDRLEQIPSVLEVTLSGGLEREVQVDVDLARLKYYGLSFDDVIDAIREENVTTPGGTIDVGELKYLVRVPGEFENTRLIEDVVVAAPNGRLVYVKDVAEVEFGFKERDSFARLDGSPVVTLSVKKRVGENIIGTSDAVRGVIDEMRPTFPPTTVVKITSDQSEDIRNMVSSLENNIISGLILVVAVLLFFLGLRNASFVGIAIPLSMLLSFSIIEIAGFTMNMVVLFSLILALGMLVDNAIVVIENIYRFREQGFEPKEAAKFGTGEVAVPIIAATATTLAAFAPMAFWPGIVGEFMGYLPKTLIVTLSASLFVAIVINPTLASLWMRPAGEPRPPMTRELRWALAGAGGLAFVVALALRPLTAVLLAATAGLLYVLHRYVLAPVGHRVSGEGLNVTLRVYERFLRWSLAHRARVIGGTVGLLAVSVVAFGLFNAGIEFFPENIPPRTVYVQVETPRGTRAAATDRIVQEIEAELKGVPARDDFKSVVATVGASDGGLGFGGPTGAHLGTVAVSFVEYRDRETDVFETLERMRNTVGARVVGADVTVEKPQEGPPTGPPINIELVGENIEQLDRLADQIVRTLSNAPIARALEGLESDMDQARPELAVHVDRERAKLFGVNTQKIGFMVRSAINGTEVSKYRDGENEYDIVVRLSERDRSDLSALANLTVVAEDGSQVPLSSVASWSVEESFAGINRKDLKRVVTVSSDVRAGHNANAVLAEVQSALAPVLSAPPPGVEVRYTGQQEEQQESQEFLWGAFLTALFLIGFILVSQFDSVLKPLLILSSVVLSTIGVLLGLIIFRMPFGIIMTGVGVISLAGVVVNNAIVLVDYIAILRHRDGVEPRESLVQGGLTRFRPVTLTAITTVVGLIPLAIGFNFDFAGLYTSLSPDVYWGGEQAAWWAPMAIAVICGLTFATFLTLVIVPLLHSWIDDWAVFFARHFTRRPVGVAAEVAAAAERASHEESAAA